MRRLTIIVVVGVLVLAAVGVGYYSRCTYSNSYELFVSGVGVSEQDGEYSVSFDVVNTGTGHFHVYGVSVVLLGADGEQLATRELGAFEDDRIESVSLVVPERPHRIKFTYDRVERAPETLGIISYMEYQNGEYAPEGGSILMSPWCRPIN